MVGDGLCVYVGSPSGGTWIVCICRQSRRWDMGCVHM